MRFSTPPAAFACLYLPPLSLRTTSKNCNNGVAFVRLQLQSFQQDLEQQPRSEMADMKQIADDVTRTWAMVAASPLEPVGVAFFLKIFEIAPEALRALPASVEP